MENDSCLTNCYALAIESDFSLNLNNIERNKWDRTE